MKFFIIFILITISTSNVFSQEYKGILKPVGSGNLTLREGDNFLAELIIWPVSFISKGDISNSFLNKPFLGQFYLTEVSQEGFSLNNLEAYSVRMRLVLIKSYINSSVLNLKIKGISIPITVKNVATVALIGRNKKLVLLSQEYKETGKRLLWPFILGILLISCLIWVFDRWYKKKSIQRKYIEKKNLWSNYFHKAGARSELEDIYSNRGKWNEYLEMVSPDILSFFETIDKYQYKEVWSEDEKREVVSSFGKIRNVLD